LSVQFNILPLIEISRWMSRLLSSRICDLWPSLFACIYGCNSLFSTN